MKIKIFMNSANSLSEQRLLMQMGQGIQSWIDSTYEDRWRLLSNQSRLGRWQPSKDHTLDYVNGDEYEECDLAVIFGSWKPRDKGHHMIRTAVANKAPRFICIETPLLTRRTDVANTYWRVGIDGYLNNDATWASPDTKLDRKTAMKVAPWSGWKKDRADGYILLALQLPGDASMRGRDVSQWALDIITELRRNTNRPIRIRSHPLAADRSWLSYEGLLANLLQKNFDAISFSDGAQIPWSDDLSGAYCTVAYTSGLSVDSVINGVPVLCCDPGNFCWSFSSHLPAEIESLRLADREVIDLWINNLTYVQWSGEEMASGLAWRYLLPHIMPSED